MIQWNPTQLLRISPVSLKKNQRPNITVHQLVWTWILYANVFNYLHFDTMRNFQSIFICLYIQCWWWCHFANGSSNPLSRTLPSSEQVVCTTQSNGNNNYSYFDSAFDFLVFLIDLMAFEICLKQRERQDLMCPKKNSTVVTSLFKCLVVRVVHYLTSPHLVDGNKFSSSNAFYIYRIVIFT